MENEKNLVVQSNENKSLNHLEQMMIDLSSKVEKVTDYQKMSSNYIQVDFRYANTIAYLNDFYYGVFANVKNSIELVPYSVLSKGIKEMTKSYKKDIKAVKRNFKTIKHVENATKHKISRNERLQKFKSFFKKK